MKKKVIAIFEDDPVNRFIYQRTLSRRDDVEVHLFNNAEIGIARAKEIQFEIVFIEMHFWGSFEGTSILSRLKPITDQSTIFVAMTAFLQEGDLEYAFASGFNMCIEKPVIFSEIDFSSIKEKSNLSLK
jgi:CheY-like chemotaxis protein